MKLEDEYEDRVKYDVVDQLCGSNGIREKMCGLVYLPIPG